MRYRVPATALRRLAGDQSGVSLVLVSLSLTALIGAVALAVDLGHAHVTGVRLQGAADNAALVGATKVGTHSVARASAIAQAAANMPAAAHGNILAGSDVVFGNWNAETRVFSTVATPINAVSVTTYRSARNGNPLSLFFAKVIGINAIDLKRRSIAVASSGKGPCILALATSGNGVFLNSNAHISADNCNVHSNSTSNESIRTNSGSTVTANDGTICAVGDIEGTGYSPNPDTGCDALEDPLAGLAPPSIPACAFTDKVVVSNGETRTLYPGRYCKGIEINSGGHVQFEPGTYIIEGDKFAINSDATAIGAGVTFYLRDKDALLLTNSDSHIEFTAPATGPFAGITIFVDRNIGGSNKHEINSDSTSKIDGVIYIPGAELAINSAGLMSGAGSCTTYIVRNLYINSASALDVSHDFEACGLPDVTRGSSRVRLVR